MQKQIDAMLKELREWGLKFPGAHLKSPWPGHLDLAVKDKTFAYLSIEGEPFGISCKLPVSHEKAMMLPHTEPTAYGLGKSGWVSAKFPDGLPPIDLLRDWIDESYRAQAPKKLVKELDAMRNGGAPAPTSTPTPTPTKKASSAKKVAKKAAAKTSAKKAAKKKARR